MRSAYIYTRESDRLNSSAPCDPWRNTKISTPVKISRSATIIRSYAREFGFSDPTKKPSLKEVNAKFKTAKITAYVGGVVLALVLFILWPALMTTVKTMDLSNFTGWVIVSMVWAYLAAAFLIFVPPIQEALGAVKMKKEAEMKRGRRKFSFYDPSKKSADDTPL